MYDSMNEELNDLPSPFRVLVLWGELDWEGEGTLSMYTEKGGGGRDLITQ